MNHAQPLNMQRRLFRITHNNCWTHWHWWGALIQQQWITLRNYNMRESSESVYLAEQSYHILDEFDRNYGGFIFSCTHRKKKKKRNVEIIWFSDRFFYFLFLRNFWWWWYTEIALKRTLSTSFTFLSHIVVPFYILSLHFVCPVFAPIVYWKDIFCWRI